MLQRGLAHYREAFWEGLFARMRAAEIDLELFYGAPRSAFSRIVPYGVPFKMRVLYGRTLWFPVLLETLKADLVIVEHSNKILINYVLFIAQFLGGPKLAFWGHGRNHQTDNPDNFSERIKIWMGRHAHWYFAYTGGVRDELIERGYDPNRVTDVQNAVAAPEVEASPEDIENIRRHLGLTEDSTVGFYCSQMYPLKRLELLIEAAVLVHEKIPSFRLVLAGAGTTQEIAENADRDFEFIHYVGPQFGAQKSAYYALSRFIAFPGLLGLGIVDAFHCGVPSVATDYRFHSPEITYLSDGENVLLTEDSAGAFADGMIRICQDDQLHERLVQGCKTWSEKITIKAMTSRFGNGIEQALVVPDRSRALVA